MAGLEGHNALFPANSARSGSWGRCFIRFKDCFDGGLQHIDPQLDEGRTQFLTAPNKSRLPARATQGVVPRDRETANWSSRGQLMANGVGFHGFSMDLII